MAATAASCISPRLNGVLSSGEKETLPSDLDLHINRVHRLIEYASYADGNQEQSRQHGAPRMHEASFAGNERGKMSRPSPEMTGARHKWSESPRHQTGLDDYPGDQSEARQGKQGPLPVAAEFRPHQRNPKERHQRQYAKNRQSRPSRPMAEYPAATSSEFLTKGGNAETGCPARIQKKRVAAAKTGKIQGKRRFRSSWSRAIIVTDTTATTKQVNFVKPTKAADRISPCLPTRMHFDSPCPVSKRHAVSGHRPSPSNSG